MPRRREEQDLGWVLEERAQGGRDQGWPGQGGMRSKERRTDGRVEGIEPGGARGVVTAQRDASRCFRQHQPQPRVALGQQAAQRQEACSRAIVDIGRVGKVEHDRGDGRHGRPDPGDHRVQERTGGTGAKLAAEPQAHDLSRCQAGLAPVPGSCARPCRRAPQERETHRKR